MMNSNYLADAFFRLELGDAGLETVFASTGGPARLSAVADGTGSDLTSNFGFPVSRTGIRYDPS